MLTWALFFLVCAFVAAILGFGGIAGAFATGAQVLFVLFLALLLLTLVARALHMPAARERH